MERCLWGEETRGKLGLGFRLVVCLDNLDHHQVHELGHHVVQVVHSLLGLSGMGRRLHFGAPWTLSSSRHGGQLIGKLDFNISTTFIFNSSLWDIVSTNHILEIVMDLFDMFLSVRNSKVGPEHVHVQPVHPRDGLHLGKGGGEPVLVVGDLLDELKIPIKTK